MKKCTMYQNNLKKNEGRWRVREKDEIERIYGTIKVNNVAQDILKTNWKIWRIRQKKMK